MVSELQHPRLHHIYSTLIRAVGGSVVPAVCGDPPLPCTTPQAVNNPSCMAFCLLPPPYLPSILCKRICWRRRRRRLDRLKDEWEGCKAKGRSPLSQQHGRAQDGFNGTHNRTDGPKKGAPSGDGLRDWEKEVGLTLSPVALVALLPFYPADPQAGDCR